MNRNQLYKSGEKMSDRIDIIELLYAKVEEHGQPITVKELIHYSKGKNWSPSKIKKVIYDSFKGQLVDRIKVENRGVDRGRSVFAYYPTKQFERFYNNYACRVLDKKQKENVPKRLQQVLK